MTLLDVRPSRPPSRRSHHEDQPEGELYKLPSFQGMTDQHAIANIIRGSLKVSREAAQTSGLSGPSTLNRTYDGADPDDSKVILKQIIESYSKFLSEEYHKKNNQT